MKNFVVALLLASSSAYRLNQHFADGLSDDEIITNNPSNVQNSIATCVGRPGEVVGKNCRTNNGQLVQGDEKTEKGPGQPTHQVLPPCVGAKGDEAGQNCRSAKSFEYPKNPLPYCTGAGGEEPRINCDPFKLPSGPKPAAGPAAAPAPRPEKNSPYFYLPGCTGEYNDRPGQNCAAPGAVRAQNDKDNNQMAQYDPANYKHYIPPFKTITPGDTNVWKLQTCAGNPGEREGVNCTAAKAFHGKESQTTANFPACTGAAGEAAGVNCNPVSTFAQAKDGDRICDGKNANEKGGCIEPEQMRSPTSRPNANAAPIVPNMTPGNLMVAQKTDSKTGPIEKICNGFDNHTPCIDPEDMKKPPLYPNALRPPIDPNPHPY